MSATRTADVVIVGGGLIALATALNAADRGLRVALIAGATNGIASRAGAGLLAPSISAGDAAVHQFALASRDRYPEFVRSLGERTGQQIELRLDGILELADAAPTGSITAPIPAPPWVDAATVQRMEPALRTASGGIHHKHDGAVDTVALLEALIALSRVTRGIERVEALATAIALDDALVHVSCGDGRRLEAPQVVIAAGAWSARLDGLPRPIPVAPLRGQMLAYDARVLHCPVYASQVYLLPRASGLTLVGSTSEPVGFDGAITAEAQAALEAAAQALVPALTESAVVSRWAGLRPMSPDGLPILGRDPECPSVVYATGHSRNGILLTPISATCIGALLAGEAPAFDLSPFSIARFEIGGS